MHGRKFTILFLTVCLSVTTVYCENSQVHLQYLPLFYRAVGKTLGIAPSNSTEVSDLEHCARLCVLTFRCSSFSYGTNATAPGGDQIRSECVLFNYSHDIDQLPLINSPAQDHFEAKYTGQFRRVIEHRFIVPISTVILDVSAEYCARTCLNAVEDWCYGFNYEFETRTCERSYQGIYNTSTSIKLDLGTDLYIRIRKGENILENDYYLFGLGRLPLIKNEKSWREEHLTSRTGCATYCYRREWCKSFDYQPSKCYLSGYLAAELGALEHSNAEDFKFLHFERYNSWLRYFYVTTNGYIERSKAAPHINVTPQRCAELCINEGIFVCRSFDYVISKGTCWMRSVIHHDVGGLHRQHTSLGTVSIHSNKPTLKVSAIHFEMKPSVDCGGIVTAGHIVRSPGWPHHYYPMLNCTWTVKVDDNKIVIIKVLHYLLQSTSCKQGTRLILSDVDLQGNTQERCLNSSSRTLYSTSSATLTFHSDNQHNLGTGFSIKLYQAWPCNGFFAKTSGEIASMGYDSGQTYRPGITCRLLLQAPEGMVFNLEFDTVDLSSFARICDTLEVFDGRNENAKLLKSACGRDSPFQVNSTQRHLLIKLTSKNLPKRIGRYHGSYVAVPSPHTSTTEKVQVTTITSEELSRTTSQALQQTTVNQSHTDPKMSAAPGPIEGSSSAGGMSRGKSIGIGIGVSLCILLVVLVVFTILFVRRRRVPRVLFRSNSDLTPESPLYMEFSNEPHESEEQMDDLKNFNR